MLQYLFLKVDSSGVHISKVARKHVHVHALLATHIWNARVSPPRDQTHTSRCIENALHDCRLSTEA